MISSHSSRSNGVSKSGSVPGKAGKAGKARGRTRVPARQRRFSAAEHARALSMIVAGMQRQKIADAIGCTTESLRKWYAAGKKQGLVKKLGAEPAAIAPEPAAATSSAPLDPGVGLGEHEVKAILDYKKKHPSMGTAQIRAQLKRFLGWRVSVKAIARVLRQAGFPPVHISSAR